MRNGRSPVAKRRGNHTPRRHWQTHTVVAALRLDNLAAHKQPAVRTAIEAVAAHIRFLPGDSPDFNPIE